MQHAGACRLVDRPLRRTRRAVSLPHIGTGGRPPIDWASMLLRDSWNVLDGQEPAHRLVDGREAAHRVSDGRMAALRMVVDWAQWRADFADGFFLWGLSDE